MKCENCRGYPEMNYIDTCCKARICDGGMIHCMLEEPYWKCPICKCEVEDE